MSFFLITKILTENVDNLKKTIENSSFLKAHEKQRYIFGIAVYYAW